MLWSVRLNSYLFNVDNWGHLYNPEIIPLVEAGGIEDFCAVINRGNNITPVISYKSI